VDRLDIWVREPVKLSPTPLRTTNQVWMCSAHLVPTYPGCQGVEAERAVHCSVLRAGQLLPGFLDAGGAHKFWLRQNLALCHRLDPYPNHLTEHSFIGQLKELKQEAGAIPEPRPKSKKRLGWKGATENVTFPIPCTITSNLKYPSYRRPSKQRRICRHNNKLRSATDRKQARGWLIEEAIEAVAVAGPTATTGEGAEVEDEAGAKALEPMLAVRQVSKRRRRRKKIFWIWPSTWTSG